MKNYLIGILVFISLMSGLNGLKGEIWKESQPEISLQTLFATHEDHLTSHENGLNAITEHFSFDFLNLKICDILASSSVSFRGVNFPKNMKFTSTIQILSSQNTSLFTRNSKNLYFHYCFVKSSYRYFVYTLKRLLI